ncbi:MAG: hypothetical protein KJ896_04250, partial [Nanoarchaeota archaeon]|nr:hypothetical protein [Nanoarchaeota archaeon]
MDSEINKILEDREQIVWQDKINRKVLTTVLIISLVVVFIISGIFYSLETINYTSNDVPKQISGWIIGSAILLIG